MTESSHHADRYRELLELPAEELDRILLEAVDVVSYAFPDELQSR